MEAPLQKGGVVLFFGGIFKHGHIAVDWLYFMSSMPKHSQISLRAAAPRPTRIKVLNFKKHGDLKNVYFLENL